MRTELRNLSKSDACLCELLTSKTWEVMSNSNVHKSWITLYSCPAKNRQNKKKCWAQVCVCTYSFYVSD